MKKKSALLLMLTLTSNLALAKDICFSAARSNLSSWIGLGSVFNESIMTKPYAFNNGFDVSKLASYESLSELERYTFHDGKKLEITRNPKGQAVKIRAFHSGVFKNKSATDFLLSWDGDKCSPYMLVPDLGPTVKSKDFVAKPTWSYSFKSCNEIIKTVEETLLQKKLGESDDKQLVEGVKDLYKKIDRHFVADLNELEKAYGSEVRDMNNLFKADGGELVGSFSNTSIAKYGRVSEIKKVISNEEREDKDYYRFRLEDYLKSGLEKDKPKQTSFVLTTKEAFKVVEDSYKECNELFGIPYGDNLLKEYREGLENSSIQSVSPDKTGSTSKQ